MQEELNLYTHNGLFHADDVFATAMLSLMARTVHVKRGGDETVPQDPANWIIFDIGGGELDHHTPESKERNGTHPNTNIPYAACGLVWRRYYKEILAAEDCPESYVENVYAKLETSLILGIDASDNGFDPMADEMSRMENLRDDQRSTLIHAAKTSYTVSALIKDFNPSWESDQDPDEAFNDAVSFAKDILLNRLDSIMDALDGRDYILQHIDYSADHLMILDHFAPWQGVVTSQSHYDQKAQDLWYVVSPALRGGWNIQCVLENPAERTSYRHPLPSTWYGLRGEELAQASGVADAKFCHPSGFLAGADSQSGALAMAAIALKK
jgi:uncharacterized UPF0160 family protein